MQSSFVIRLLNEKIRPPELVILLKKILGVRRKTVELGDGRKYWVDPVSDLGYKLISNNLYEEEMSAAIASILKQGDAFVDIGSNEGYFSVLASKLCGKNGKVFAVEPQSRLWQVIAKNISINDASNIHIVPFALGSQNANLTLHLYSSLNSGASTLSKSFNFGISFKWLRDKLYGSHTVRVLTLDSLEFTLPSKIKLAKIDIEGFEYEALLGMTEILKRGTIQNLVIETHPQALESLSRSTGDIDRLLKGFGYSKHALHSNLFLFSVK